MSQISSLRKWLLSCLFVLSSLAAATRNAEAGTWSEKNWQVDADFPHPEPDKVTHAIAFGKEASPPIPAPFQLTDQREGGTWELLRYPEETAAVLVSRRSEGIIKATVKMEGAGATLLRGRLIPQGKPPGGLVLELSGLEPGARYRLDLIGLTLIVARSDDSEKPKITVTSSDAPGESQVVKYHMVDKQFHELDYTAPSNGRLKVTMDGGELSVVRLCGFLNYKAE